MLALAASRQIPDNGRGSSFLRNLALPLTTLIVILFANKAFRTVGLPLIEQVGPSRFAIGYAICLVGSGLWLTATWILNQGSLREAFASTNQTRQHTQTVSKDEDIGQDEKTEAPSELMNIAATSAIDGYVPSMLGRYRVLKEL